LLLRLVEELAVRGASSEEVYQAHGLANTSNLQAVLCFLDYTRLRKEEERTKKEAGS
jgi:hypothetical protein